MSQTTSTITKSTWNFHRVALIALFGGAAAIAFSPIFVRLSQVGPTATAFWRVTLAVPVLWLWMNVEHRGTVSHRRPESFSDYRRLALVGLLFAADLMVWHQAITLTSVANATLLPNFAPVFVTLGAWLFFKQKITRTFVMGLVMALLGAILLIGVSVNLSPTHLLGDTLGLLTALFYGSYILAVSRLRRDFSAATVMTWVSGVGAVILLPATLLSGGGLFGSNLMGWAVLFGLALFSHAGGQGLIAYALAHLPPAFSSVSLLMQPVLAALLAWALLNEALGLWQSVGGIIVLAGVMLARRGS